MRSISASGGLLLQQSNAQLPFEVQSSLHRRAGREHRLIRYTSLISGRG